MLTNVRMNAYDSLMRKLTMKDYSMDAQEVIQILSDAKGTELAKVYNDMIEYMRQISD